MYSLDWGPRDSLRETIYFQLALAIEVRSLEDLKICQWCKKLFVLIEANQRFCAKPCRIAYNNHRRLKKQEKTKKSLFQEYRDKEKKKTSDQKGEQTPRRRQADFTNLSETGLTERILKKYLPEVVER